MKIKVLFFLLKNEPPFLRLVSNTSTLTDRNEPPFSPTDLLMSSLPNHLCSTYAPNLTADRILSKRLSVLSLTDSAFDGSPRLRKLSMDSTSSHHSSLSSSDFVKRGTSFYRISEFTKAFRYFQKAVGTITNPNSFSAAQSLACIGNCYLLGHGPEKNILAGLDFFKEASKATLKRHQLELFLYFVDRTSSDNCGLHSKTIEWLLDIADGYAPAQYLVGQCYLQGLYGCLIQKDLGDRYLKLASSQHQNHNDDDVNSSFSWLIFQ